MSPSTGRPTSNPKGTSQHVRLDERCLEVLDAYAKQEGISRAEAIRRGILKLEPDIKK